VGNGMSYNEDKAHFSLWCMLAAPLAAGNDLRKMSTQTRDILTNKEMIAVDQDARGISAFKMEMPDSLEMWVKPLKNNELAICFLNRTASSKKIDMDWKDFNISDALSGLEIHFDNQYFSLRDLWLKKDAGKTDKKLVREIASHEVIVFKLSPVAK
jgi:alpha-galactosidase